MKNPLLTQTSILRIVVFSFVWTMLFAIVPQETRAALIDQNLVIQVGVRHRDDRPTDTATTSTNGNFVEALAENEFIRAYGNSILHGNGAGTARMSLQSVSGASGTTGSGSHIEYTFETDVSTELMIEYSNVTASGFLQYAIDPPSGLPYFGIPRNSSGIVTYALDPGTHSFRLVGPQFSVIGTSQDGAYSTLFNWGLDGLPGETPDLPIFPNVPDLDSFIFDVITDDDIRFYDPVYATGYDYTTDGTPFASVLIPDALPGSDDTFELLVGNQSFELLSGQVFDLTTLNPNGISQFGIRGISVAEQLDPNDPLGFVTGLSFIEAGNISTFEMTAVTSSSAVPEPSALISAGIGLFCISVIQVRRRRSANSVS